jgi:hypothetical protein
MAMGDLTVAWRMSPASRQNINFKLLISADTDKFNFEDSDAEISCGLEFVGGFVI